MKKRIAVLLGDGAGVGPELVAMSAASGSLAGQCDPIILGDERVFRRALKFIGKEDFSYQLIDGFDHLNFDGRPCFYDMRNLDPADYTMGETSAVTGKASIEQLDLGLKLWKDGIVGALLFGPLNKVSLKAYKGEKYASEMTYIREVLQYNGPSCEVNHMKNVFTTRVTSHVPLADVCRYINKEAIMDAARLLWKTMKEAGYEAPRIAVAALNPHGGENGTCGREEIDIIAPAIEALHAEGIPCEGPIAADSLFFRAFHGDEFDGVVTMYHDQGQIPLKLLGFVEGIVAIQGGIPCPILTPSHGTAFEIAGTGTASVVSFEKALKDAVAMAQSTE
ncbi:MAG: 4-hydroxythreonine-4-phosphate dehydrogenase PdxA [Lachnospiraceae bacterium]|nr:4-hydroxythreonine-4-phosphate dehydrogenase PdxA [Lachnospiraceae bacterium]